MNTYYMPSKHYKIFTDLQRRYKCYTPDEKTNAHKWQSYYPKPLGKDTTKMRLKYGSN